MCLDLFCLALLTEGFESGFADWGVESGFAGSKTFCNAHMITRLPLDGAQMALEIADFLNSVNHSLINIFEHFYLLLWTANVNLCKVELKYFNCFPIADIISLWMFLFYAIVGFSFK